MTISLTDQKIKLDRLLDERATHYRRGLNKNRLTFDEATTKHAEVDAIRRTFAWLIANADWIRKEDQRRRLHAEQMAELERHPAVAAVLSAFPDAAIAAVRPIPEASP